MHTNLSIGIIHQTNSKQWPIKIPEVTEGQLLFISDLKCCICKNKGDHIHHLDGNSKNNTIDNLVFLCFACHDKASIKGGLSKRLTKEAIIEFRYHHYKVIDKRRRRELGKLDHPVRILSEEKLLVAAKNAYIIIEVENIKAKYFSARWNERSDILEQLNKYVNHANNRLAYEILDFLSLAAGQTRGGMTEDLASCMFSQILNFCPSLYNKGERKQEIQLAKECIHIGHSMAYDAFIYLRHLTVAMYGLIILKLIYRMSKENNIVVLNKEVQRAYHELKSTLNRPDRTDLNDARQLLEVFHNDLETWDLTFPLLSDHLMARLNQERSKSDRKDLAKINFE